MCGRFSLTADLTALQLAFPHFTFPSLHAPRYNIAPSQPVLVIANDAGDRADFYSWGLIPSWTKTPPSGRSIINARAETLAEKPSFRGALKYKRCLILADGFYEWQAQPGSKAKIPFYIQLASKQPFAFAGLWEDWHSPEGAQIKSCAIITTAPNSLMGNIHNRMPVILPRNDYAQWLEPAQLERAFLSKIFTPFPATEMGAYPVSTLVNSPASDRPECIAPIAA